MIIIDNNALTFARENQIPLVGEFITTPDVQDEYEAGFDSPLPKRVTICTKCRGVDAGIYLQHYKRMLNLFGSTSLYGMRGLGDVSILALLSAMKTSLEGTLPFTVVTVITSDQKLKKRIEKIFCSGDAFDAGIRVVTEREYFGK